MISFLIAGSGAPDMPLQVVHAKATMPKPSFSSSAAGPLPQVQRHGFRTGRQRGLHPGLAGGTGAIRIARQQPAAITLRRLGVGAR